MKFKKIRDNHDNELLIKDHKKKMINAHEQSLHPMDSNITKTDISVSKKNLKNTNNLFKQFMYQKSSKFNRLNNNNVLTSKKNNFNSIKQVNNKNIDNVQDKNIIISNNTDNKKLIKFIKNKKNKKKNNMSMLKGSEKKFVNYKKKNKSCLIKNFMLHQKFNKPTKIINKVISIGNNITVSELSNKIAVKQSKIINILLNLGISATSDQILEKDIAQLVIEEMGHKVHVYPDNELEYYLMKDRDFGNGILQLRPPIVTMVGHVDHGKTSLLDYIRSTKVAFKEAGGITQYIGAYHVNTSQGIVTFLDTPGHAAFTAMRARGTKITDIVVLVVAADDGVMPQTIEAIQHAKNANVPIIVAINKIDKTTSNINKIKKELMKYSIISEEFGGENIFVLVSAKTGIGVDNLLSAILLQAEMLELKTVHTGMATGIVIESFLDIQRGPVATVLINEGTLHIHDIAICGAEHGKIKLLRNEFHENVSLAGPSIPVEVFGLSGVPRTGDKLIVVRNEKKAKELSLYRKVQYRENKLSNIKKIDMNNLFDQISTKKISDLNIILKADTQGSLEVILDSLNLISDKVIKINVIMSGVGSITETDAYLSITTASTLIGFNVRADISAKKVIELEHLNVRYYSIIYNLISDVKVVMSGLLIPINEQKVIGLAEVRSIFKAPKFGLVAGCMVKEGIIKKSNPIRVLRDNIVIYEGELESLRRFKEDVIEVRIGFECGIGVKNYNDIRIGDVIEVFKFLK